MKRWLIALAAVLASIAMISLNMVARYERKRRLSAAPRPVAEGGG